MPIDDPPVPRDIKRTIVIVVGIVIAINLAIVGVYETKTDPGTAPLPDAIVTTFPRCGQVALRQAQIGVQLAQGYTGDVTLDGTPLPEDEYDVRAFEQGTILWQPGPGKAFTRLAPGLHLMRISYSPTDPSSHLPSGAFSCDFKAE